MDAPRPLLVVKIGGSLFSDKRLDRTLNRAAIDGFAHLLADLAEAAHGRLVLISGGGSFGHAAVRSVDPDDPHATLPLTEANFALKWIWTQALRARGVRAVPIQLAAVCVLDDDGVRVEGLAIRRMLAAGILPVLSGDSVLAPDASLRILGSDRVPEVVTALWSGPVRVVVLTDVPGVLADGPDGDSVIAEVDADAPEAAYAAVWGSAPWDTSNAMAGKVEALVRAARAGADCHIVEGNHASGGLRYLLEAPERWPDRLRGTRIRSAAATAARA